MRQNPHTTTKITILKKTTALPASFARPAISWYSKVTKSVTRSIALFIASAKGIPMRAINIKSLYESSNGTKKITGNKHATMISSTRKEVSFAVISLNPFSAYVVFLKK